MTPEESVDLVDLVISICPASRIEAKTAEGWFLILAEYSFRDAVIAVRKLAGEMNFIGVSDIKKEILRLRDARAAGVIYEPDPNASDADDRAAELERRKRAGDGLFPPLAIAAAIGEPRPMPELGGVISQMLDNIRAANHHPALLVRCPWCKAAAKTWCLKRRARSSKEHVRGFLHPARLEAAEAGESSALGAKPW